MSCPEYVDASFGPWAGPVCRGGLDFTISFELVFFSLVPSALFIVSALWQCRPIQKRPQLARQGKIRTVKLLVILVLVANAVACTVLIGIGHGPCYTLAVAAACVECVALVMIGVLSRYKHIYSPRPSILITIFLSANIVMNLATVRSLWLMGGPSALATVYTVNMLCKTACLVLENIDKRSLLVQPMNYSPEEVAGPLSRIFFSWLVPLLIRGYATILSISTLSPLSADLKSAELTSSFASLLENPRQTTLVRELITLRYSWMVPIIPRLFLLAFTIAQPFLIYTTIDYTSIPREERNIGKGQLLIGAFVLTFSGFALSNSLYWHLVNRFMMVVRGSLISLIYSCTVHATSKRNDSTAALTLMTVDVEKAMIGLEEFYEIWASVVQIVVAVYILATQMSWASVAPIAVPLICFSVTIPLAAKIGLSQKSWNGSVEKRVSLTAAVLSSLREVRVLGIGPCAEFLIQKLRADEIERSHHFRRLMTCILILSQGTTALGPLATFALYTIVSIVSGNSQLLAAKAFTSLSLVNLIASPFPVLVQALPSFAAGLSSLSRIEAHVSDTRKDDVHSNESETYSPNTSTTTPGKLSSSYGDNIGKEGDDTSHQSSSEIPTGRSILVRGAAFGWAKENVIVKNVNFEVSRGYFVLVTGPVGTGKSTLLYGLLGETPVSSGEILIGESQISFCPQSPWLVSGTIRHIIVCGARFDEQWYNRVISACALTEELRNMTQGDMHQVGNDGINLSGGQRQRVVLARAVYARNKLVILDEPLSGLDKASMKHIVQEIFSSDGLFRRQNAVVIMATGSLDLLHHADQILLLTRDGSVQQETTLDNAAFDRIIAAKITTQKTQDCAEQIKGLCAPAPKATDLQLVEAKADLRRKTGDWTIYAFYCRATGYGNAFMFLLLCTICAFCFQFSTIWIKWWSDASTSNSEGKSAGYYLGLYAVLCCLALIALALASWTFMVRMVTNSGSSLHSSVLDAVFKAPVAHFDSIDNGITLNRFNQDMQLVDYTLPMAAINTFLFASICAVQAIIISTSASYMAVGIPVCLIVIFFLQNFYLRTSRQLRLLDIEAKAPLFTNFKETIQGIASIRAYGGDFGSFLEKDHQRILDDSQQPIYLLYTVQRWLSLVLDLLVAGLATLLIVLAVNANLVGISGSAIGVALVNLTSFNQYQTNLIRFWASIETSLGAISRIKDFTLESPVAEGAGQVALPSATVDDTVVFEAVTATYQQPPTPSASPGSPDGLCRHETRCYGTFGKWQVNHDLRALSYSTVTSGNITIGGIDISKLDQNVVQDRLNAVTQTNFFLPGLTVRENLDPRRLISKVSQNDKAEVPDEIIQEVLENLNLWETLEARGGLDEELVASSWSAGQLQLLSLARSILKARRLKSNPELGWKILVLDEATSNVDPDTATIMRKNIRQEFSDYTIIAVMHKFESVIEDMDQMLVLEGGRVTRQGTPREMLQYLGHLSKAV